MPTSGVTTPNLSKLTLADELVANREGNTGVIPVANVAQQLVASGAISEALRDARDGRKAYLTRAELLAVTNASEGTVGLVTADPTAGYNGQYRRTGATWVRFADLDNATVATEVQVARGVSPTLGARLNAIGAASEEAQTLARQAAGRAVSAAALPALAEAGVVLVFMDRDTGSIAGWIGGDGVFRAEIAGQAHPLPAPALDYVPLWGADRDGEFFGFSTDGEVIGQINRAFSQAGIAPDLRGYGLDWSLVFADARGEPAFAHRRQGGLVDLARGRAPVVGTEWLTPAGVQVAPLTVGAFECVVAYMRSGERRVLTPPGEARHYRAPELAYGGVSVRCWRANGAGGELVAVSIERPGFVVADDPDVAWLVCGDGQSLAQGSHGAPTPWPFTSTVWPDHLMTVQNTVLPGDIRSGRNAGDYLYRLDPATLGGLTPIRPQTGILSGHGLTPVEALVCQLQDDIVTLIGRPQRIVAWTGGVGGASINQINTGTANDLNQRDVMAAAVAACRARGWSPVMAAVQFTHGETDAPMLSADYAAAVSAYRDDLNAYVLSLTGQSQVPVWLVAQPSSFAESIDDETTRSSVIGMMQMMAARPADTIVTGPGYADQSGYAADCMHMTNAGYLAQGEANAGILRAALWGGAKDRPLHAVSATISGAVITVQWSEPVEFASDMPVRLHHGVEVSNAANSFLTILSHTLEGQTSTITLSAPVDAGDIAGLRVQIGMTGQSYPERLPENVPTTNIRTIRKAYRAYATGVERHRHALHQRLPVTQA